MKHIIQKYKNKQPLTEQEREQLTISLLEAQGRANRRKKWEKMADALPPLTKQEEEQLSALLGEECINEQKATNEIKAGGTAEAGANALTPSDEMYRYSPDKHGGILKKRNLSPSPAALLRTAAMLAGVFLVWQIYTAVTNNDLDQQLSRHLAVQYPTPQTRMGNLGKQTPDELLWLQFLQYFNEKQYPKSQQALEQLLQKEPQNVQYLYYKALSQIYQEDYEQALQSFAQIEQLQSPMYQYEIIWHQALAHLKLQQWGSAKTKLNQLIQSQTNYSTPAQHLLDKTPSGIE